MKKHLFIAMVVLASFGLLAQANIKERRTHATGGSWVTTHSLEIGEYKQKSKPKMEIEVHMGKSTSDNDAAQHWIQIEHEIQFSQRQISQEELESLSLGLQSITINGVTVHSEEENTSITSTVKKDKLKETFTLFISLEEMQAIIDNPNWSVSIASTQYDVLNIWIKNTRKLENIRHLM